jgi:nifR3 family TIM-barrel protein
LDIFDYEKPVGIQIFGGDEEAMALSAKIIETVNPDLVDINFGCPVKKVVCKGAGAGVLKNVDLMVRLTKAVVNSTHLQVTVKTRLGWDTETINIMEVAERLQETGIKALTIHARTRSQMYKGEADWNYISEVKNNPNIEIPIFGNGDIDSPEKALEYRKKYNCDGIMIGRAAIGYPWIFNEIKHFFTTGEKMLEPTINQRLEAVRQHAEWSTEWKGERLGLIEMRQHYSNYFRGIPHFKDFRKKFLEVFTLEEIDEVIAETKNFYEQNLLV